MSIFTYITSVEACATGEGGGAVMMRAMRCGAQSLLKNENGKQSGYDGRQHHHHNDNDTDTLLYANTTARRKCGPKLLYARGTEDDMGPWTIDGGHIYRYALAKSAHRDAPPAALRNTQKTPSRELDR